jgi:arginine repressor
MFIITIMKIHEIEETGILPYDVLDSITKPQARAMEIYLASATYMNEFKPTSFKKISEQLKKEGLSGSESAVQRWCQKLKWKRILKHQQQIMIVPDDEKSTEEKAVSKAIKTKLVDLERNSIVTAQCYDLMEDYIDQVRENKDKTGFIHRDDIKIVKDIAVFTAGREDRFLDRVAEHGGEKITSNDLKEQFKQIDIDIEDIEVES